MHVVMTLAWNLRCFAPVQNASPSAGDPAENQDEAPAKKKRFSKFGKDPTVNTDFLPDRDRELEEQKIREKLKAEWLKKQEKVCASCPTWNSGALPVGACRMTGVCV